MSGIRTVAEARAAARTAARRAPDRDVIGMCLRTTRGFYGVGNRYRTAADAYAATRLRGRGPAPAGAIHWWLGGSAGFGHVALGEGPRRVWSIDNVRAGAIDLVTLARIERTWPSLQYKGWTRDINGEEVLPLVALPAVQAGRVGTRLVVHALVDEGLLPEKWRGVAGWDRDVTIAYARWQERAGFGKATPGRPGPSDGRPGIKSLTALGLRRGFAVRP